MSHTVIITQKASSDPSGLTSEHVSYVDVQVSFSPSHHLGEAETNRRIAMIRRRVAKLCQDLISTGQMDDSRDHET